MANDQQEIRRKLRILNRAAASGDVSKTCFLGDHHNVEITGILPTIDNQQRAFAIFFDNGNGEPLFRCLWKAQSGGKEKSSRRNPALVLPKQRDRLLFHRNP
jgi:hypothetical protein